MKEIQPNQLLGYIVIFIILLFGVSYSYLAIYHKTPFLLNTVIHENGQLTLLESIFTFDHVLGQWPMILIFAIIIPAAFLLYGSSLNTKKIRLHIKIQKRKISLLFLLSIVFLLVIFAGSIIKVGFSETLTIISQSKENPLIYSFGGNWNMMLLSNVILFFISLGFPFYIRSILFKEDFRSNHLAKYLLLIGIFITITLSFVFRVKSDIFSNPRWLAHSIREVLTNTLITFPFSFGILFSIESAYKKNNPIKKLSKYITKKRLHFIAWPLIALLLISLNLFLLGGVKISGIAQSPSFANGGRLPIAYLVASHFFEHILDYFYIALLSVIIYQFVIFKSVNKSDHHEQT